MVSLPQQWVTELWFQIIFRIQQASRSMRAVGDHKWFPQSLIATYHMPVCWGRYKTKDRNPRYHIYYSRTDSTRASKPPACFYIVQNKVNPTLLSRPELYNPFSINHSSLNTSTCVLDSCLHNSLIYGLSIWSSMMIFYQFVGDYKAADSLEMFPVNRKVTTSPPTGHDLLPNADATGARSLDSAMIHPSVGRYTP